MFLSNFIKIKQNILCTGDSISDLGVSMLDALEKVHEYLNENKLVFNVD